MSFGAPPVWSPSPAQELHGGGDLQAELAEPPWDVQLLPNYECFCIGILGALLRHVGAKKAPPKRSKSDKSRFKKQLAFQGYKKKGFLSKMVPF